MRIRCPYCDCHYDIHPDTLGNPLGSEKLGFGWWLRCYQCQKKFWLKSTVVINTGFAPMKADRTNTIRKLSKMSKIGQKKHKISKYNGALYILIIILIVICGFCYTHMSEVRGFFASKVKQFTASAVMGLQLSDIVYRIDKIDGRYRISVMGNIVNNTQSIQQCNGLHIVVLDNNTEITSWTFMPDIKNVIPGDKLVFNTDKNINIILKSPKILVRTIN